MLLGGKRWMNLITIYSVVEMSSNTTDMILTTNCIIDRKMNLCCIFHKLLQDYLTINSLTSFLLVLHYGKIKITKAIINTGSGAIIIMAWVTHPSVVLELPTGSFWDCSLRSITVSTWKMPFKAKNLAYTCPHSIGHNKLTVDTTFSYKKNLSTCRG